MKTAVIHMFLLLLLSGPCSGFSRVMDIPPPDGYARKNYPAGSYSDYLQNLPLKNDMSIYQWDGKNVWGVLYNVYAVLDKPLLFRSDLEQCADFSMRLWADYHKSHGDLNKLYLFDYHGSKKYFSNSGKKYNAFLKWHMAYSNSYSIKKGASAVIGDILDPGDMFVQNTDGGIGHVSIVVDVAVNQEGDRVYLIGYGFIPAQEFHIEKAKSGFGENGWFTKAGYVRYLSRFPFKRYGPPVFRRFD